VSEAKTPSEPGSTPPTAPARDAGSAGPLATKPYRRPVLPWERAADPGQGWARWASVGLEFGLSVALCTWGGWWLDGRMGWSPWGTLAGAMLGVASGLYLLVKAALAGERKPAGVAHPDGPAHAEAGSETKAQPRGPGG